MDVLEFLKILKEKIKPILVLIALGILVGILSYFVLTPVFETSATFMVLKSKLLSQPRNEEPLDVDTYLNFVDNESLYYDIYLKLNIQKKFNMDFDEFKHSFEVTTVEDTAIIKLLVTFQDSATSFQIAKMLGSDVLSLNRKVINEEVHAGYRFTESQLNVAYKQFQTANQIMDKFLKQHPLHRMAMEVDSLRNRITLEENGELLVYPQFESASMLGKGVPGHFNFASSPFQSLLKLENQKSEISLKLALSKSDNEKLDLNKQLDILKAFLVKKKNDLSKLKTRQKELESVYYSLRYKYSILLKTLTSAREAYGNRYQTVVNSKIQIVGKTKEMAIIDQPIKPQKQAFPKLIITLIAGLFLGILASFAYITTVAFSRKLKDA